MQEKQQLFEETREELLRREDVTKDYARLSELLHGQTLKIASVEKVRRLCKCLFLFC